MNTTLFSLLFFILTAHCAIYRTRDVKLNRIVRSPHYSKSDSEDSSVVFRTQNWSGVARGADGAQGVFSGAAAATGSVAPSANEAISIAASGAVPVKDKLQERFGGSDHYLQFNPHNLNKPYFPDHHESGRWAHGGRGHDFHHGYSGYQRTGFNYGQFDAGANSQAFAKSGVSANDASACEDGSQNDLVGNGQQNINKLSESQTYTKSNGIDTTQNKERFSSSQSQSTHFQSDRGFDSGLHGSQGPQHKASNRALNGGLQTTAESKTFTQAEPLKSIQQVPSFGNGFSNFQGSEHKGGQQVESNGKGFGSSQGLQKNSDQNVESLGNDFGSSQGSQNGGGQQVASYGSGFSSSQNSQNDGGQEVKSYGSSYSDQGFQNSAGHKNINQANINSFGRHQSQKASYGFDHNNGKDYGSQLSNGFENTNGNDQSNYNEQSSGFTENGQKYANDRGYGSLKYQTAIQAKDLQSGAVSEQSSNSGGNLNNNFSSNGKENLSSDSGSSGQEDLQSTLSGALGLASQGLQASQNQPCSTCQKGSYAFSNAKSHSGSAIALSIGG